MNYYLMILEGAPSREVYELYYQRGYINKQDIEYLLEVDRNFLQAQRLGAAPNVGDIWEIDVTLTREQVAKAKNAASLASTIFTLSGFKWTLVGIGSYLFIGPAQMILDKMLESNWNTVRIQATYIYQYNEDNFTFTWMPCRFFELTYA